MEKPLSALKCQSHPNGGVVCNSSIVMECDVASDKGIEQTFKELKSHWDDFDILVHSVTSHSITILELQTTPHLSTRFLSFSF
jgi:enoyl-[acyl-carrier-protein] reductase (NADH)